MLIGATVLVGATIAVGVLPHGLSLAIIVMLVYFLPTAVAVERKVPNQGSIAVINVFLGWTFVGWVVALAMAARTTRVSTPPV